MRLVLHFLTIFLNHPAGTFWSIWEKLRNTCQNLYPVIIWSVHIRANLITGRNEVLAKVIFLHVCVILFTRGGCLKGGVCLEGGVCLPGGGVSAWRGGVCLEGGVSAWRGVCLPGGGCLPEGGVCLEGGLFWGGSSKFFFGGGEVCLEGGSFLRGEGRSAWRGVFFWGGSSKFFFGGVSPGIWSTFGQYASFWNAFLFYVEMLQRSLDHPIL